MSKRIVAVIGRGYGDEGKGLATDWLCLNNNNSIVVKHNGGAQAGHTVDLYEGKRFIFHQLGSGSFRGAETYWADSYLPDLYKLDEEVKSFKNMSGFIPKIYSSPKTNVTLILDVLVNHSIETLRGKNRHGSCGMGINEADLRTKAGFGISMSALKNMNSQQLKQEMVRIREEYYPKRLKELGIDELPDEYKELFYDDNVLKNVSESMLNNLRLVELVNAKDIIPYRENVVFETGQGLLLDADFVENYPHVTASKTGLTNIIKLLDECNLKLDEAVYVTRSYITRHGAGSLKNEVSKEEICKNLIDLTNQPNPWQGTLRFALYDSIEDLLNPIREDIRTCIYSFKKSLLITHLNETDNNLKIKYSDINVIKFKESQNFMDSIYLSDTPYSEDIK